MTKACTGLVLSLALIASLGAGCSDSKARQASRKLARQADEARRLCDRANAYLADTPFLVSGTYASAIQVGRKLDKGDITLLPPGSLDPQALDALDRAQKDLTAAMQEAQGLASADEMAVAQQVLAGVFEVRASYHAMAAAAARRAGERAIQEAKDAAALIEAQAAIGAYYHKLLGMSDAQLQQEQAQVAANVQATAAAAKAKAQEVKAMESRIAARLSDRDKAAAEASRLTRDAQEQTAEKAIEINKQAAAIRKSGDAIAREVLDLGTKLDQLKLEQAELELQARSQQLRAEAINVVVSGRRKQIDVAKATNDALVKSMTDQGKELTDAVAVMDEQIKKFTESMGKAREAYGQALQQLLAARPTERPRTRSMLPSQRGMVYARQGELWLHEVRFQARVGSLLDAASGAWSKMPGNPAPPAPLVDAKALLGDQAKLSSMAMEDFDNAVKQYEVAVSVAPAGADSPKWSDCGNLAMVYVTMAQVAPESRRKELLDKASRTKDEAIAGRENSVYAAELQGAIDAALGIAPVKSAPPAGAASAPAPEPAPAPPAP